MKICEIERAAVVAWSSCSEYSSYFATGNIVGSLDSDFSSSAKIELFDSSEKSGTPIAVARNSDRFTRLAWGNPSPQDFPLGVIAGSNVDGTIQLFNPERIMNKCVASSLSFFFHPPFS